jgi:hypothetical protein
MAMQVGMETPIKPIPPIEQNMRRIPAGRLTFGVEFRYLNDQLVAEHMAGHDEAARAANPVPSQGGGIDDSGVSIHVFGVDGHEYLRFDCFEDGPHYHYIAPGAATQRIVPFDTVALGDPLAWTLQCLRERLGPMLRAAGGEASAQACEASAVAEALAKVEASARQAVKA